MSTQTETQYRLVEELGGEVKLTENYAELIDAANAMLNECGGEEGMPGDTVEEVVEHVERHGGLTIHPYPGCVFRLLVMGGDQGEDKTAPSLTDELIRWVSVEARKQNGWEVLGIDCCSGSDGVIRFHREGVNIKGGSGLNYGTAHFATGGVDGKDVVAFEWGHYDLAYHEAREDFAKRVEAGR